MSGHLLPIGWKFTDDNDDPLDGGKLYAFAAGSATPKAIYAEAGLSTPLANPFTLDSAGVCIGFIEDGESYKFVLKNALGITIETFDNIAVPTVPAAPSPATDAAGVIKMYGGSSAPTGFLLCDGTAVSRSTYALLFAAISTRYGVGNGSTTFNLPDLRGRFPLGLATAGTGSVLGQTGGTIDHVHAGPSHTHSVAAHHHSMSHTHSVPVSGYTRQTGAASAFPSHLMMSDGGGGGIAVPNADGTTGAATTSNTGDNALTSDASGTGNTGTANPPYAVVNFIIATGL